MLKFYLLTVVVFITIISSAQTPALVKDIYNFQNNGSNNGPGCSTAVGSNIFFATGDCVYCIELWEIAGNWGGNAVPNSTSAVVIPAGRPRYPVIGVSTTVKSISCATGTSVIVNTGLVLNVLR